VCTHLLAESAEVFDVYAKEVSIGAFERRHANTVIIETVTGGTADVMWTRF